MFAVIFQVLPLVCSFLVFVLYLFVHPKHKKSFLSHEKHGSVDKLLDVPKDEFNEKTSTVTSQLELDKELYHQLQNLEYHPDALVLGYNRLLSLFDVTLDSARSSSTPTILTAVPKFSVQDLKKFLDREYDDVAVRYEAYLQRRKNGGAREIFPDINYAKYWLRTVAPVKFVDGAWLGGIHRLTTNPRDRSWTKTAWQVLSEELGDGDIQKNHVWVYQELLKSIDASDIGTGDSKDFISSSKNVNNDRRVWKAAVAQLCISLFPELFLPEILGFNLSYESLPLHLLITVYELRELNIDPYYFVLHVSIDNKHSGHAAMGMEAVTAYMNSLPFEEQSIAWRRIQAGFILASELATTPVPRSELDTAVEKIFSEKTKVAKPLHMSCPAKIGGRTGKKLSEWLDPTHYPTHSLAFLRTLADSRWIVRGQPESSRLIAELKWGGRMFGAFTAREVNILESWIRALGEDQSNAYRTYSYEKLTGIQTDLPNINATRTLSDIIARPSAPRHRLVDLEPSSMVVPSFVENKSHALRSLLAASSVPFEYLPSLPAKCASIYGMTAIKCLRALHGFSSEGDVCAGMDEVLSNATSFGVFGLAAVHLTDVHESVRSFVEDLLCLSAFPEQNESILVGLQSGIIEYVFTACKELDEFSDEQRQKLEKIRERCQQAIDDLVKNKSHSTEWLAEFMKGKIIVKNIVTRLVN